VRFPVAQAGASDLRSRTACAAARDEASGSSGPVFLFLVIMPIYAYKCDSCGHRKDVLQKISDPLLTVCPACGAPSFVKQVTAAGFQLKGSGWYVTDFRDGGAKKDKAAAETGGDKPADKAADKPADGAPAAAPAPAPASNDASAAKASAAAPAPSSPSP
jgi:putative FmdB family regulatory protein